MGHRSLRRFPVPKIFSSRIFVGYPQKILQYPIFGSTALISIVCVWFLRFQYQIPSYNENMFKQQISWSDLNSRQNSEIQLMFQSNPAATEMYFQPSSLKHEKLPTPTRVLSLATMPPPPLWEQIDTNGLTRASPHYRLIRPDDYGLFSCAGWGLGGGWDIHAHDAMSKRPEPQPGFSHFGGHANGHRENGSTLAMVP